MKVEGGCEYDLYTKRYSGCITYLTGTLNGTTRCFCSKHLCNGIDLGRTKTLQNTTTTNQKTNGKKKENVTEAVNFKSYDDKLAPFNGIEGLEVAIVETLVLIACVSFLFH